MPHHENRKCIMKLPAMIKDDVILTEEIDVVQSRIVGDFLLIQDSDSVFINKEQIKLLYFKMCGGENHE
jgi:hypothetical protein